MKTRYLAELRSLFALSSPILIAQLLMTGTGAIDTLMAGNYQANDLAAIAIGSSLWLPPYLFVVGVLIASTAIIAQQHGARQPLAIASTVRQSIWLSLLLSLLVAVLLYHNQWLTLIDIDPAVTPITADYLQAVAFGMPSIALLQSLRGLSEGLGHTRPFMVVSLIAFVCNIPLNYAFIYGHWGFPELGGAGCGWATAIVMWLQTVLLLLFTLRGKTYQPLQLYQRWEAPQFAAMWHIAKLGLPIALAIFAEVSLFAVVALLIAPLGASVVGGHQVALSFSHIMFMVPMSLSQGITIRVGHFLGQGEDAHAAFAARSGIATAAAISLLSFTFIILCRDLIAGAYTNDAEVQIIAASLLWYAAIYQLPDAIQVNTNGALRGYHDTQQPMLMTLVSYWLIGLPLGYSLALTDFWGAPLGAQGFWQGLVAGLACSALLLSWRLQTVQKLKANIK